MIHFERNIISLLNDALQTFTSINPVRILRPETLFTRAKKHMTVLIGTSGDTGSAAINAVRGLKWVDVVVLLPKVK